MFAVIQFSPEQGGGLALVNNNWLTPRKREVFWPPYKEHKQFTRSVRNSEQINTETWRLYNVHRIFYESDDYEKAVEKLKKAEDTSDLQTEVEEENFIKKRKRLRPVRFESSSDSDVEDNRRLPPPPPIKTALFKAAAPLYTPRATCSNTIYSHDPRSSTSDEKSGFQLLLENIIEVKNQNKLILAQISKFVEKEKPKGFPEKVPVKLPLKTIEDIQALEIFLKDPQNVMYYSGLGGNNIASKTNKILRTTLDDVLTSQFNYFGRNKKKPFNDLQLSSCIVDAVKYSCNCTSTEVESAIKIWLKHAPQRLRKTSNSATNSESRMSEGKKLKYYKEVVGKRQVYRRVAKEVKYTMDKFKNNIDESLMPNLVTERVQHVEDIDFCEYDFDNSSVDILNGVFESHRNTSLSLSSNIVENEYIFSEPYRNEKVSFSSFLQQNIRSDQRDLAIDLRHWALRNSKVPLCAISDLLHVLSPFYPTLPLDARTLLATPVNSSACNFIKLDTGEYVHLGLVQNIKRFLSSNIIDNNVLLSFNIDGLPLFNNSTIQIWPILVLIQNSSIKSKPFAVGIFCGKSKPKPVELYLEEFVNELFELLNNGLSFNNKLYTFEIHSFVCDAPATAFIKCIKLHNGYSACGKCTEPGDYVNGRMVFSGLSALKRSDHSFRAQTDKAHHMGNTPLLKLNFDLVECFPIDYMHCICLGVVKKLITSWISGNNYKVRFSRRQLNIINSQLETLNPFFVMEFNRKIITLDIAQWKATQFRTFLLYVGPLILQNVIDKSLYEHFLLLHCGISILLSQRHLKKFNCDFAGNLLQNFVSHCRRIYGLDFLVYNIHNVSHLADDARKYGTLDNISAFPFENYLGKIKTLVRSPRDPLKQLFRRLTELNFRNTSKKDNSDILFSIEHSEGPSLYLNDCRQYKKVLCKGMHFSVKSFSISNCYFLTLEKKVFQIENILQDAKNKLLFIGKEFLHYESLYHYPFQSNDMEIYVVHQLSELKLYYFDDIITKCMVFPFNKHVAKFVAFPLLHDFY